MLNRRPSGVHCPRISMKYLPTLLESYSVPVPGAEGNGNWGEKESTLLLGTQVVTSPRFLHLLSLEDSFKPVLLMMT